MFELVLKRLADSSDVIFVMGVFIFLLGIVIAKLWKKINAQEKAHQKVIIKLTVSHNNETKKLNADILKALIDSTAAMVSVDGNYKELRGDINDLKE